MLDDLKYIHEKDAEDALGVAEKQWQQLLHPFDVPPLEELRSKPIHDVVLAGMGGSALAADILRVCPGLNRPFEIVRGYTLPQYVGADTLFVASSYSGNTEETIAALREAESKKARIVIIAAGGKLQEIANDKGYPFFKIPSGFQPRMAVYYNYAGLTRLMESCGLIAEGSMEELGRTANWLKNHFVNWVPTIPTKQNQAKQIALELMGKSVVIYAGPEIGPAAYKWKINCNENAKNVAWCNQLPEFNHNEFLGWTSHPTQKPYAVVDLRSNLDNAQIQKRFEVSAKLLSGRRPEPIVVQAQGETQLEQLFWTIYLGDFVSLYLALLNGLNPSPVELIERLKKELA